MKKLKLNELNLDDAELLSREELKKVLGGTGSGSGTGNDGDCCTNENCVGGDRCLYSGPDGCGYKVCLGLTNVGCLYNIDYVSPPPCGYA